MPAPISVATHLPAAPAARARRRVAHVAAGMIFGGVETMLVTIAAQRDASPDVEPLFILCSDGALAAALRDVGAGTYVLPTPRLSRPATVLRARRALRALLDRLRPDAAICHAPWSWVNFSGVLRSAGVPALLYAHDAPERPGVVDRIARLLGPDRVVANSAHTAARAATLYAPREPVRVSHPPMAPLTVTTSRAERRALRAALGATDDTIVIVQVSRLAPFKGQRSLLRAAAALPRALPWAVWIVGGAQSEAERAFATELEALAAELGIAERVRFLGQRADVPALLAAADVFCQPNDGGEAFGLSFVEAMRAGLPVVTTAVGAAPEVVTPDVGLLVPAGDDAALRAALGALVGDRIRREGLGLAGPARASRLTDASLRIPELHRFALDAAAGDRA